MLNIALALPGRDTGNRGKAPGGRADQFGQPWDGLRFAPITAPGSAGPALRLDFACAIT